jgi:hypothetical protein
VEQEKECASEHVRNVKEEEDEVRKGPNHDPRELCFERRLVRQDGLFNFPAALDAALADQEFIDLSTEKLKCIRNI